MKKLTLILALVAMLALPAFASGHGQRHAHGNGITKAARAACQEERSADQAAFTAKYGNKNGKRAMRRCIVRHVRGAAKTCRSERRADREAFRTKYANEKGRHAFKRCVRQHTGDPVA